MKPMERFKHWDEKDMYIIFAAMVSMVLGVHSVEDNLTDAQWERAEKLFKEIDEYINEVFPENECPKD